MTGSFVSHTSIRNCELYYGRCEDVLPELRGVDAVLCDLPYGTTRCSWDTPIDLEHMWDQLGDIVKVDGAMVFTAQTPFDKVLGSSNLPLLRYEWIWEKTSATGHLNAKKMPLKAHENVLVFYRKLPVYNPQKTSGHVRKTARRVNRAEKLSECYGDQRGITDYDSTERYPRSVIKFATDKQTSNLHPTQKPLALMEYLVRTYTSPGDTVLDFTMGSGTTGHACINFGRKFIGIEKEAEHFNTAVDRLSAAQASQTLEVSA